MNVMSCVYNELLCLYRRFNTTIKSSTPGWGGGVGVVLPYMGYIGMCRCEGYVAPCKGIRIPESRNFLPLESGILGLESGIQH